MRKVKLFEQFIAEKREDVGKYNTVKKVIAKLGRRPSEQELATFINNNYYDVTEVERGDDDPSANDKIADLVAFYKFDIDDWQIAWADAQNESVVTEAKTISFAKASMMGSKLLNKISIGTILDTKGGQYEITGFGQQSNAFKEFEATIDGKEVKVKLTVMYGLKLEVTDDVRSARFNKEEEVNSIILESLVTEAVAKNTKVYQIATPAPKAMLVEELEDLFGDDYRHIITEFDDDERYESVLVFNLTPRDIKRIQEEIGDVLIWEYSIKKGKEISESAMIEALSASDRKAIAYTMAEQDPSKIKDLQDAIGQEFSDNYSSTNRSILVDVKKKGGKWVAITSETESEYNNKKPKKGKREATIGITWNAMFF